MSEWISVEKELPKKCLQVLLFTHINEVIVGHYCDDGWVSGNEYISWDFACNHGVNITHWMELPETPKTDTL